MATNQRAVCLAIALAFLVATVSVAMADEVNEDFVDQFVSSIWELHSIDNASPIWELHSIDNASPEAEFDFAGEFSGSIGSIDAANGYTYVGEAQEFFILDMSDPAFPVKVGSLTVEGWIKDVLVSGDYAYVTYCCELGFDDVLVLDISDPSQPGVAGSYHAGGSITDLTLSDGYAYLAESSENGSSRFVILDVNDPAAAAIEAAGNCYVEGKVKEICVSGNYAYLAREYDLLILNLTDLSELSFAGNYCPGGWIDNICLFREDLLVTCNNQLLALDLSNPVEPVLCDEFGDFGYHEFIDEVFVEGDYVYFKYRDYDYSEVILILNYTDSDGFIFEGSFNTWDYGERVDEFCTDGPYVYMKCWNEWEGSSIRVLDVSSPAEPTYVGFYNEEKWFEEVCVSEGYAYIICETGDDSRGALLILNVSDSSEPVLAGRYDVDGWLDEICINESLAYLTCYSEYNQSSNLLILNVSNPSDPLLLGTYNADGWFGEICIQENRAYLTHEYEQDYWLNEILILDINDPSSPVMIGNYSLGSYSYEICVDGNYAYMSEYGGYYDHILILDISNCSAPVTVSIYEGEGWINDLKAEDNYVYFTYYDPQVGYDTLKILDVSNHSVPVPVGTYFTEGWIDEIFIEGNRAYLTVYDSYYDCLSLMILDISNRSNPVSVGSLGYSPYEWFDEIWVDECYVYLTCESEFGDSSLLILDASNPSEPVQVGFYGEDSVNWLYALKSVHEVYKSGNYAYLAYNSEYEYSDNYEESYYPVRGGFFILDVSNPGRPVMVGVYDAEGWIGDINVEDNHAYLTTYNEKEDYNELFYNELLILDLSNPAVPVVLGNYTDEFWIDRVCVSEGYAYLGYQSESGSGLLVLNVNTPEEPAPVGTYTSQGSEYENLMCIDGGYAFLTSYSSSESLLILDISTPSDPILVGEYLVEGYIYEVCASEGYAYLVGYDYESGSELFLILDISNPSEPEEIGRYYTDGWIDEIFVGGDYVFLDCYIPEYGEGLLVLDVSNHAMPKEAGFYYIDYWTPGFCVSEDYIYLANPYNGFLTLKFNPLPMIFIDSPIDDRYYKDSLPLNYTVSEPVLAVGYELYGTSSGFYLCDMLEGNTSLVNLSDGSYIITLYAKDFSGKVSSKSAWFNIDTVLPVINVSPQINNSILNNDSVYLECWTNEVAPLSYSLDESAIISFNLSLALKNLEEGTHNLCIYAEDLAGNNNLTSVWFTVDTIPPVIIADSPLDNAYYNVSSVNLDYSINEIASSEVYSLDEGEYVTLDGNSTLTDLEDGVHNLTLCAEDLAGNSNQTTIRFTIDTISPLITVDSPIDGSYYNTSLIGLNYSVDETTSFEWYCLDGSEPVEVGGNLSLEDIGDGLHSLTVYAEDLAGNVNSTILQFAVDTVPPVVRIGSPVEDGYYNEGSVDLNYWINDATSIERYSLDGGDYVAISGNSSVNGLSDGAHTLTLYAEDLAGNNNSSSVTFTVDTVPPVVEIESPLNSTYYATDSVELVYRINEATSLEYYSLDGSDNFTINGNLTLNGIADGVHSLTVYAKDLAGNTNSKTASFTTDVTLPTINSVVLNNTMPIVNDDISVEVIAEDNLEISNVTANGVRLVLQSDSIWRGTITAIEGSHPANVSAIDLVGNIAWNNSTTYLAVPPDTEPPMSISELQSYAGLTWINWTWVNPEDEDFSHTMVYLDGNFVSNVGETCFNATLLEQGSTHTISTRTVDFNGNINATWVNSTVTTASNCDLIVSDLTWIPENFSDGQVVKFNAIIENIGTGNTSRNFYTRFFIDDSILGGSWYYPDLATGSSVPILWSWTATPGNHTIKVVVDYSNSISESNESNNALEVNLKKVENPDLIVSDLTWSPENFSDGQVVKFNATIENIGTGNTSRDFYIRFIIDDSIAGSILYTPDLASGSSVPILWSWTATPGNHTIKVVVDYSDSISESDESNNELEVNLTKVETPDLIVSALSWSPENFSDGQVVKFNATIENIGNGNTSRGFNTRFLIDDSIYSGVYHSGLMSSSSDSIYWDWVATPGDHTIKVIADVDKQVTEFNESNNELLLDLNKVKYSDLVVSHLTWTPQTFSAGSSVTFNAVLQNVGDGSTFRGSSTGFFVGEDLIGTKSTSGILKGDSTEISWTWIATAGDHNVSVIADCNEQITESNENNNFLSKNLSEIQEVYLLDASIEYPSYSEGSNALFIARVSSLSAPNVYLTDSNLSLELTVFDCAGSTLYNDRMNYSDLEFREYVDLTGFSKGSYNARVSLVDKDGLTVEKTISFKVVEDFTVSVSTDKQTYDRDEVVHVTGWAQYDNGSMVSNTPAVLKVDLDGYIRQYVLVTDEEGKVSYYFDPGSKDAGNFNVNLSVISDRLWRNAETSFEMYGLYMKPSGIIDFGMSKNSSEELTLNLYNYGASDLHGLSVNIVGDPAVEGVSCELVELPLSTLTAGDVQTFKVKITAENVGISQANFSISVSTDEGSYEDADLFVHLYEAIPVADISPISITVGMNTEDVQLRTVNITNVGYETMSDIYVSEPDLNWVSLSSTDLGNISAGASQTFDIIFQPTNETVPGIYQEEVTISSSNHQSVNVYFTAIVTDSDTGDLLFHVTDDVGQDLSGSSVLIQNPDIPSELFQGVTNETGYLAFEDVSIGDYNYFVKATDHESISGSVEVSPDVQTAVTSMLPTDILELKLTVTPRTIEDEYQEDEYQIENNFEIDVGYDIVSYPEELVNDPSGGNDPLGEDDIQPPLLIPDPWYVRYGVDFVDPVYEKDDCITITNAGYVSVFNVLVDSSSLIGVDIIFPTGKTFTIEEIKPHSSITIPYHLKATSVSCSSESYRNDIKVTGDYISYVDEHLSRKVYLSSEFPVFVHMYNCPVGAGSGSVGNQILTHFNYDYHPPSLSYSPELPTWKIVKIVETVREKVKFSISQEATLERDAFAADLELTNKLTGMAIEFRSINLEIRDMDGNDASDLFFVKLTGGEGVTVLSSLQAANVNWILIPKPGTGGTDPAGIDYTVQAFIDYAVEGLPFSVSSNKEKITVKPQPLLNLKYTVPEKVKDGERFRIQLDVENIGYGTARNLRIDSGLPVIYENEAGIRVLFKLLRSGLEGGRESQSLAIDFGGLEPGETKTGYWIMKCTKDGEFKKVTGSFTHSNELGGMETSLINDISYQINHPPEILCAWPNPPSVGHGGISTITVNAVDQDNDELTYSYEPSGGEISGTGSVVTWTAGTPAPAAPRIEGLYFVDVIVSDGFESTKEQVYIGVNIPNSRYDPDLIIQDITWPSPDPKIGDNVPITVTVKNIGAREASSSKLRLFVRGIQIGSATLDPIPAGFTASETFTWTADKAGDNAVSAIADADKEVAESLEENNYMPKTIKVQAPDLEITDISWAKQSGDDEIREGDDVVISYWIRNKGDVDSGSFKTTVYIDGCEFKTLTHSSIPANDGFEVEVGTWRSIGGIHSIKVEADVDKDVDESKENNNDKIETISVGQSPDIYIAGFEVTQGIQNMNEDGDDNNVSLIYGKPMMVRVFVESNTEDIVRSVRGKLRLVQDKDIKLELDSENEIDVGPVGSWSRDDFGSSLNFMIYRGYLEAKSIDPEEVTFEVEVNPRPRSVAETTYENNKMEKTRQLNDAPPLKLALIRLNHISSNKIPSFSDFQRSLSCLERVYPINKIDYKYFSKDCNYDMSVGTNWDKVLKEIDRDSNFKDFTYKAGMLNRSVPAKYEGKAYNIPSSSLIFRAMEEPAYNKIGYNDNSLTFGHELGHAIGMRHVVDTRGCCGGAKDSTGGENYPYDHCNLSDDTSDWGYYGFDIQLKNPIEPWKAGDIMTYRRDDEGVWISNYTYEKIFSKLIKDSSLKSSTVVEVTDNDNKFLLLSGEINLKNNNITFDPFYILTADGLRGHTTNNEYTFELMGEQNTILSKYNISVYRPAEYSPYQDQELEYETVYFTEIVPYPSETKEIIFKHNLTQIASIVVTPYTPNITIVSNDNLEPIAGPLNITWTSFDLDGDELYYMLEFSPDNGSSWQTIAIDINESNYCLNTSNLQGTRNGLIRVTVTDGINTASDLTSSLSITLKAPEVAILSPLNGTNIATSNYVALAGAGYDLEDGMLNDSSLLWFSDQNGVLGIGSEIWTQNITRGVHKITLIGEDSDGYRATDQITISVIDSTTIDTPAGTVNIWVDDGVFTGASRLNDSSIPGNSNLEFPFGVFKFNVSELEEGQSVNVSMMLPQELPSSAKWYCITAGDEGASSWQEMPVEVSEDNRTVTIQLTDGGTEDNDLVANGRMVVIGGFGISDISGLGSIEDLNSTLGSTWINWTWTNPSDPAFSHTEIYLNSLFQTRICAEYFNATALKPETDYTIGTRTVDTYGNVNETWVNLTATTGAEPALDVEPPVFESVVLFPANTTAGSTIDIEVNATDNVGVAQITAGDTQLTKTDGIWQGSITAPSSIGEYSLSITASDAAGNTAETSAPYHVVLLEGGADIAVSPRASSVVAGNNVSVGIKVKNTQNIDDIFKVRINIDGVPDSYCTDLSCFGWTETDVQLRAGEERIFPLEVAVTAGTAAGYKLFRANVDSESSSIYGFDTGYLIVSV